MRSLVGAERGGRACNYCVASSPGSRSSAFLPWGQRSCVNILRAEDGEEANYCAFRRRAKTRGVILCRCAQRKLLSCAHNCPRMRKTRPTRLAWLTITSTIYPLGNLRCCIQPPLSLYFTPLGIQVWKGRFSIEQNCAVCQKVVILERGGNC